MHKFAFVGLRLVLNLKLCFDAFGVLVAVCLWASKSRCEASEWQTEALDCLSKTSEKLFEAPESLPEVFQKLLKSCMRLLSTSLELLKCLKPV